MKDTPFILGTTSNWNPSLSPKRRLGSSLCQFCEMSSKKWIVNGKVNSLFGIQLEVVPRMNVVSFNCNRGRPGRRSLRVMLHGLPMQKFESVKHLTYHNRLRFVKSWIDPKTSVLLFVRFDPPTGRFPISIKGRFALNLFLSDPQKWPGKVESKINLPKIIGRGRTSYFHGSLI